MPETTIILTEDNTLDEQLVNVCRNNLIQEAGEIPIISVSQKPINVGTNICVGEIGKNWKNIYIQIMKGLEATKTEYVAIAEHDCLYTNEHFNWIPPTKDTFYYNRNHWILQWTGEHTGTFSYWPKRSALSQLICSRDLLMESVSERLFWLNKGYEIQKGRRGAGEPGVCEKGAIETDLEAAHRRATCGRPVQLHPQLKSYLKEYPEGKFDTKLSNLDVRHRSNFSGPKRGRFPTMELPYWGTLENIITKYSANR
jgi:hypothetical protein